MPPRMRGLYRPFTFLMFFKISLFLQKTKSTGDKRARGGAHFCECFTLWKKKEQMAWSLEQRLLQNVKHSSKKNLNFKRLHAVCLLASRALCLLVAKLLRQLSSVVRDELLLRTLPLHIVRVLCARAYMHRLSAFSCWLCALSY